MVFAPRISARDNQGGLLAHILPKAALMDFTRVESARPGATGKRIACRTRKPRPKVTARILKRAAGASETPELLPRPSKSPRLEVDRPPDRERSGPKTPAEKCASSTATTYGRSNTGFSAPSATQADEGKDPPSTENHPKVCLCHHLHQQQRHRSPLFNQPHAVLWRRRRSPSLASKEPPKRATLGHLSQVQCW